MLSTGPNLIFQNYRINLTQKKMSSKDFCASDLLWRCSQKNLSGSGGRRTEKGKMPVKLQ